MSAVDFSFEGIAAPPSRNAILREGISVACRRLEPQGSLVSVDGEACVVRDDGSALITVRQKTAGFGEEPRLVRIAIRVKEAPVDGQAIEAAGTRPA